MRKKIEFFVLVIVSSITLLSCQKENDCEMLSDSVFGTYIVDIEESEVDGDWIKYQSSTVEILQETENEIEISFNFDGSRFVLIGDLNDGNITIRDNQNPPYEGYISSNHQIQIENKTIEISFDFSVDSWPFHMDISGVKVSDLIQ